MESRSERENKNACLLGHFQDEEGMLGREMALRLVTSDKAIKSQQQSILVFILLMSFLISIISLFTWKNLLLMSKRVSVFAFNHTPWEYRILILLHFSTGISTSGWPDPLNLFLGQLVNRITYDVAWAFHFTGCMRLTLWSMEKGRILASMVLSQQVWPETLESVM